MGVQKAIKLGVYSFQSLSSILYYGKVLIKNLQYENVQRFVASDRFGPCHCEFQQYCIFVTPIVNCMKELGKIDEYGGSNNDDLLSHMIENHRSSILSRIPDQGFVSAFSMVRNFGSAKEEDNTVPCELNFNVVSVKKNEESLGLAQKISSTSSVSSIQVSSENNCRLSYSSCEKRGASSSDHLPIDAGNFNLATTDGSSQTRQKIPSSSKEKHSSSAKSTPDIEKKYVHSVYDAIAPHFSSTRFAKWPKVAEFLDSLTPGSIILDAGCGNGKYLGINPNCFFIGCDISSPLINICANRGHEVLVGDAINLPYRTGFGDAAISIAVLHHLSTEERRKKAIEELVRVVCKGGKVLITVWAVEQEDKLLLTKWTPLSCKYMEEWVGTTKSCGSSSSIASLESIQETENSTSTDLESVKVVNKEDEDVYCSKEQYLGEVHSPCTKISTIESDISGVTRHDTEQQEFFVPWHLPYHRAEISGASASAIASGLAKKDDKKGAVIYNRYYHVFAEGELESLASGIKNAIIIDRFYDKSNWCIIIEKI